MNDVRSAVTLRMPRVPALARFAVAISGLTVLGHAFFGFEQSYLHPVVGALTAYVVEFVLETLRARTQGATPTYRGGGRQAAVFLLAPHITGLTIAMLTYSNERMMPLVFTVAAAIASKYIFRVPVVEGGTRHFLNPSNFGIALTLTLIRSVGLAPPYQVTAQLSGVLDVLVPMALCVSGTFLNAAFTRKMPLILGWLVGFVVHAVARTLLFDANLSGILAPMTGPIFVLFTFFMVTDPGTTPTRAVPQLAFGFGVAMAYLLLMSVHVVFALFYALVIVSCVRGAWMAYAARRARQSDGEAQTAPCELRPAAEPVQAA